MVGASISSFLLAGVLSTFLLMGRTAANVANYTDIEANARKSLETLSREVRVAYEVTAYSANSVTLLIPDASSNPRGAAYSVSYAFDAISNQLTRSVNSGAAVPLLTGVYQVPSTSFFNYYRYVRPTTYSTVGEGYFTGFTNNTATSAREIKQIEVSFILQRRNVTVVTATNKVLSARFIMRNK